MEFRKATEADLDGILKIIRQAQEYFREQGISQWQNDINIWENKTFVRKPFLVKVSKLLSFFSAIDPRFCVGSAQIWLDLS